MRIAVRVIAVLLLMVAAVVHAVGANEYPGVTRPALRFITTEVLPLLAVAALNLVAYGTPGRAALWRGLAVASSAVLLASLVPHVQPGAPPVFLARPVLAVLLLGIAVTIEILERR